MMRRKNADAATEEIARALFLEEDILPTVEKKIENLRIEKPGEDLGGRPNEKRVEAGEVVGRSWR